MEKREWITEEGTTGELPVKIMPNHRGEFILGFAEDVVVDSFNLPDGEDLVPGDVCILTGEIDSVADDQHPVGISVNVSEIEFIRLSDQRPSSDIDEMLQHLDEAKELYQERVDDTTCENCRTIDASTRLTVNTEIQHRDLHFCANCGRLLSTSEYKKWTDVTHR
jgi:hypothetical protein